MRKKYLNVYEEEIFFESKEQATECTFLKNWLLKQLLKIEKKRPGVQRKGQSKTGPKPLSKERELFSLAKAFNDKLKLKPYAEFYKQNYVVIRRWNNDLQIEESVTSFRQNFGNDFVSQIEKLLKNYDFDSEITSDAMAQIQNKCLKHVNESRHYDTFLQHVIEDLFNQKIDSLPDNQKTLWLNIYQWLTSGWGYGLDLYSPPKNKKEKNIFIEEIKRQEFRFNNADFDFLDHLKKLMRDNEKENAIFLIEQIKKILASRNRRITELSISVINKGKKSE